MADQKDKDLEQVVSEHEVRIEKVKKLLEMGIEPWPAPQDVNATCQEVLDEYKEGEELSKYSVAGRVITWREHGKTIFGHIQDRSGKLQVYIKKDLIGDEQFDIVKGIIDIGDIIWVSGHSFKTKTGEITVKVEKIVLQSKCLYPLPEKFHGLADVEIKYRQLYLDLIIDKYIL